jgi:hypothetical protein
MPRLRRHTLQLALIPQGAPCNEPPLSKSLFAESNSRWRDEDGIRLAIYFDFAAERIEELCGHTLRRVNGEQ